MSQRSGKAVQYERFGAFDVVQIVPIERPSPGPGEIVVEVAAAGLNHVERFLREGRLQDQLTVQLPARQGVDFSGVVVTVGEGAKRFKVGDEVLGHAPEGGSHATWVRGVPPRPTTPALCASSSSPSRRTSPPTSSAPSLRPTRTPSSPTWPASRGTCWTSCARRAPTCAGTSARIPWPVAS